MEEEIVKEIVKKSNMKKRLVEELIKICKNFGEDLPQAKNKIINYIDEKEKKTRGFIDK